MLLRASRPVSRRMLWSSRIKDWSLRITKDGTIEIFVGWSLIALFLVDSLLVHQQNLEHEEFLNKLTRESSISGDLEEKAIWYNMPTLFECIVRKQPLNLDGNKCLTGVNVGDKVQVLEEKVGPSGMYNLCRSVDDKGAAIAVGWFPTQCLEKVK